MSHQVVNPHNGLVAAILAPLKIAEGFRHLWLGDTGQGKTVANQILIREITSRKLVDIVLTIDDKVTKKKPQYEADLFVATPTSLKSLWRPLDTRSKDEKRSLHVSFRGVALTRNINDDVVHADVATMGWDLILKSPVSILLNIDELADATNRNQAWLDGEKDPIAKVYAKGRGCGYSVVATTQLPQTLPREAFALSETIGIFRMDAREAAYLARFKIISEELEEVVPSLGVGEFVIYRKAGGGWDGVIYKFPFRG